MTDRSRRLLCRVVFVGLCLVPAGLLMVWAGVRHSPPYRAACAARLRQRVSQQLGLAVQFDALHRDRHGVFHIQGLRLSDPEQHRPIAEVRYLQVRFRKGRWLLVASQPELQRDSLDRLWSVLHERLLRRSAEDLMVGTLVASELTLHGSDGSETIAGVQATLDTSVAGPQARIQFRLPWLPMNEPAQVHVVRDRQRRRPVTRIEFRTGSTPLPCSLIAQRLPLLEQLGDACRFQGTLRAAATAAGWEGSLEGQFHELELNELITRKYPHTLRGRATLVVRRAHWVGGKLVDAAGSVQGGAGVISPSLLHALNDALELPPVERPEAASSHLLQYQQLDFGFVLNGDGLMLSGNCRSSSEGTVLRDLSGPLLLEPRQLVPVISLVRALVPQSQLQVPATRETNELLQRLPVPSIVAPSIETARVPVSSPLRLRHWNLQSQQ